MEKDIENLQINGEEDDVVTPWNVESQSDAGIDYDKLISNYHSKVYSKMLDLNLLNKILLVILFILCSTIFEIFIIKFV